MSQTEVRTVLITGATSGIGRHAALHLARAGFQVFASGRSEVELGRLAEEAAGLRLTTLALDVNDPASIRAAAAAIDTATGGVGIDALVNNAGFGVACPSEQLSDEDLRAQFETNVFGLMAVTRAFLPRMRERGFGRVINVSSIGGRITLPFFGGYNATKYAVESLSDALRVELRPFGVDIILLEPGVIGTNFTPRSAQGASPYRQPGSPYEPAMLVFDKMTALTERTAARPDVTSRAIERALRARRPKARYVTPLRDRLGVGMLRLMPTRWSDAIKGQMSGFSRRRLRSATVPPRPARVA
jgi:NAD(P)-dependent dehydrogenase (short-subunit alcohol dehydrogenase family)